MSAGPQCDHDGSLATLWTWSVDAVLALIGRFPGPRPRWTWRVAHALPCRRAATWSVWAPGSPGSPTIAVRFACTRHVGKVMPGAGPLDCSPVPGSLPALRPVVEPHE